MVFGDDITLGGKVGEVLSKGKTLEQVDEWSRGGGFLGSRNKSAKGLKSESG